MYPVLFPSAGAPAHSLDDYDRALVNSLNRRFFSSHSPATVLSVPALHPGQSGIAHETLSYVPDAVRNQRHGMSASTRQPVDHSSVKAFDALIEEGRVQPEQKPYIVEGFDVKAYSVQASGNNIHQWNDRGGGKRVHPTIESAALYASTLAKAGNKYIYEVIIPTGRSLVNKGTRYTANGFKATKLAGEYLPSGTLKKYL
jgi:hypothetical protein